MQRDVHRRRRLRPDVLRSGVSVGVLHGAGTMQLHISLVLQSDVRYLYENKDPIYVSLIREAKEEKADLWMVQLMLLRCVCCSLHAPYTPGGRTLQNVITVDRQRAPRITRALRHAGPMRNARIATRRSTRNVRLNRISTTLKL